MNKKMKMSLIAIICLFVLLGTVTFAWIKELAEIETDEIHADGSFKVLPDKMDIVLLDSKGNEVEDVISFENMVPNQICSFKVRFYNFGDETTFVKLTLANIEIEKNENDKSLLDCMWVSLSAIDGYDEAINFPPKSVYMLMNDSYYLRKFTVNEDTFYNLLVMENMNIPVTGKNNYVEFSLNFILDQETLYEFHNLSMSIGKIIVDS